MSRLKAGSNLTRKYFLKSFHIMFGELIDAPQADHSTNVAGLNQDKYKRSEKGMSWG